ncbi:hypothetical protein KR52_13100 [Synechococcus sp. KORDI-52]|nr:hypothetical protein KR52_13100 [Synechococcus sp. KORDI-52]
MTSRNAILARKRCIRLLLVLLSIGVAVWLNLPLAQANERLPGQANRIGDLWKLNAARHPCATAETLPANAYIPPQQREAPTPIPVGISIHINEIPEISDTYNRFQLDGLLTSTWCDSRSISDIPVGEDALVLFNNAAEDWLSEHWSPQLEFTNRVSEAFYQTQTITIRKNGSIERMTRFEEQLGSEFKLEKFPFDQQLLRIYVQSFTWDQSVVRLVNLGDVVSLSRNSRLPEWEIKNLRYVIRNHDDPEKGSKEYSRLSSNITIKRRSGYYIYKIFMPLGILTFTSIFFLAIPINAFADRMAFISGLLFTTLAYQIIIASAVPRVPYLTLGDTYTIFLFTFMIAEVFIAYHISQNLQKQGNEGVPTIERAMEIFLPLIFILFQTLFIWLAIN